MIIPPSAEDELHRSGRRPYRFEPTLYLGRAKTLWHVPLGSIEDSSDVHQDHTTRRFGLGRVRLLLGYRWLDGPVLCDGSWVEEFAGCGPAVEARGWAVLPKVLTPASCSLLLAEVQERSFSLLPVRQGEVRQQGTFLVAARGEVGLPAANQLVEVLEDVVAHSFGQRFKCYAPNEFMYQRYSAGSDVAVSTHRDSLRYRILIVVFSLEGNTRFEFVADRSGEGVLASYALESGSVVAIRAPAIGGPDDRPFHRVHSPRIQRTSLTIRMRLGGPIIRNV